MNSREHPSLAHLTGAVVVGHNLHVDLAALGRKLPDWRPAAMLDTLKLARRLIPGMGSYRLGVLTAALDLAEGLPAGLSPHRATYDALVTARLLTRLAEDVDRQPRSYGELCEAGSLVQVQPEPARAAGATRASNTCRVRGWSAGRASAWPRTRSRRGRHRAAVGCG